jgi:hypothetical protein
VAAVVRANPCHTTGALGPETDATLEVVVVSTPPMSFGYRTLTLLFAGLVAAHASAAAAQGCAAPPGQGAFVFTGLNPAIEGKLPLSTFKRGQVVEIDPVTMPAEAARDYIKALHDLGARVSIYLVGGHCDKGRDCDALGGKVKLGSTGSWNWDKSESRILEITHKQVKERLAKGIVNGFMLGANYIRIDNLHHPSGSSNPRTPEQMRELIDLAHEIEDQMRSDGSIKAGTVTGIVAHNNLPVWESLVTSGAIRRPPAFLTSERTAQQVPGGNWQGDARMKAGKLSPNDVPEIEAGRRMAARLGLPYSIVEFRKSHDLASPGKFYPLPQTFVQATAKLDGVTEVIVMPSEDQYIGRAEVFPGSGPKTLAAKPIVGRVPPCT